MKLITLIIILLSSVYGFSNFKKSVYLKSPTHVEGLDKDSISSISKYKITNKWIRNEFKVEDRFLKEYNKTADEIVEKIYNSIKNYSGPCPCPYNKYTNKNRRCGGNSAYSDARGKPLSCYPADVLK